MAILQQPDALSLSMNLKKFIISSDAQISFVLKKGTEEVLSQRYDPDSQGRIEIDIRDVVHAQLSFDFRGSAVRTYEQTNLHAEFTAEIDGQAVNFHAVRGGVDNLADTATNFLTQNWLTWQPTVKPVTYYTPEFLTYYAPVAGVVKLRGYFVGDDGQMTSQKDIELCNVEAGKAYTIPVEYQVVVSLLYPDGKPGYYDVWVESASGERLTYIQRYYADAMRSISEDWVLFENSLGGVDCFRAYGKTNLEADHTHNLAEVDEMSEEYRVDTERKYEKNTGHLSKDEARWLLDFFPSQKKYIYVGSYLRQIVVVESNVTGNLRELPTNYTFTYKYADARPLLNLPRTDVPADMLDITIPEVGNFTIPPRLAEVPRLPLSEGDLFPVQNPYSETWSTTTAGAIAEFVRLFLKETGGEGGGEGTNSVDIIKLNDSTIPSDSNVFSALRSLATFLRKDKEDSTNFLIQFLGGLISDNIKSQDFASGPFGTGFIVKRDPKTGKSYIETDELYVRLKAYFDTLEIKHLTHVGGRFVGSPAGMKCNRVEILSGESETLFDKSGSQLFDSNNDPLTSMVAGGEQVYRCYFNNTDEEREIVNEFAIDDLAQCREFNVKEGTSHNVSNQYYWRRVVGLGENYIDLSMTDCDSGSMEPKAGDEIVTIGNKTNPSRQHVFYLSAYDDDAPCFKLYSGINSYSMLNKEVSVISPNADKNVFTGKVVIKPGSVGFGNLKDAPDMAAIEAEINNAKNDATNAQEAASNAKEDVNDLKGYVDGAFADGIITEAEAKAIATYINTVESTSKSVAKSYSELYNNGYLEGSAKVSLGNAYSSFVSYKDALLNAVKTAIADGKTTTAEKASVDNAFSRYNTAYASLSTAIETANKSIQDKLKGYSDNAQMAADEAKNNAAQAMEDVNEAKNAVSDLNNYVNGAFSDGIISEAEAKAISTYINTITATKKEVDATYEALYNNEYLTGTAKTLLYKEKSSFDIATTNLITAIQSAIADGKTTASEKTNVNSKFTAFNAYYSYLATAIENANKSIQDTIKSEAVAEAKSDLDAQIGGVSDEAKNAIAKNMGYADYEEMVYYAERAQTVIKGGHINTELIEASLLITSQIIANAIKTNALNVNDNFIVNTNGSVSANGTITAEEGRRKAIVSNGFIRLMAMAENWLNFSEILRITSNDNYEPEIYMQGHSHGMRYLSVTPNGITFDYVSTSTGKRTSLTIDPTVIGEGMTNAVIKKTSDGMLYVAENEETKYKLTINISGNGTTSPSPGDKYVTGGSTIRIIAYPDEGYEFVRWSDGGAQSHNIVVSYDGYSVTAYFTKKEDTKYTLSLSSSPSYAGSTSGGGSYTAGTKAYVTAADNSGYRFVRWSDGGAQSHYVTMDANKSLTAYFEAYSVTGDEIFSGTALTSSSYWKANGNTSVVSVTGGVATLKFTGNIDSGNNITFNKGYLGGKLEQGHKYRLSLSVKASSTTYLVVLIGTDMDISKSISSDGVIYGEEINTSYKSISIEITADNRDSNVSDALYLVATSDCTLYINSISLKEV